MPVEIRELLIRAEVSGSSGPDAGTGNRKRKSASPDREEIIEESVRRVLEILQKKEER